MSDTFIGIDNHNEFFTQHYLAAILAGDLKTQLTAWREEARNKRDESSDVERTPPAALNVLQGEFFRTRERLTQTAAMPSRVQLHTERYQGLLHALGYDAQPDWADADGTAIPTLVQLNAKKGEPLLWVIPVVPHAEDDTPTLSQHFDPAQFAALPGDPDRPEPATDTVENMVTAVFSADEPPRFILVCGLEDTTLIERGKWPEQRLIRIDWNEVLGRRSPDTLDITAALLHADCLAPRRGNPLLDTLDDNSHKHAFEVSEDLKYALQASIERLGNAAVAQLLQQGSDKTTEDGFADQLSRECLRYMYRLLFLFYIEARPELGYAPMGSDAYRTGYSLDRLRELEQLDLQSEEARRGHYIHDSLALLFGMIHDGARPKGHSKQTPSDSSESVHTTFTLDPLRSHLFDPSRTPLLNTVVLPNEVLRDVIEWMSLSRRGGKRRRGRISYATLGINQLGAVYEALLSYRGFFATTDLFEVKPAKQDGHDVLKTAYFVPEDALPTYSVKERVYEDDGNTLKRYPAGTFIYRLAGRDRQTSASYYTPEVLTRSLVHYTLKEILEGDGDRPPKKADEILHLTVCEPAMGSAAFLNEAVNQLSEAYLRAKQNELKERIPHHEYATEKQRVKMYIADNNVYGVDLNPVAKELAEVSLWLNTIHEGGFVPWFGGQTACGNSLIGARKQVFSKKQVRSGKEGKRTTWLSAVPERVPLGTERTDGSVYHFLLGDQGMAQYGHGNEGKPIKAMAKDELEHIKEWRKEFCAPVDDDDWSFMADLSGIIDKLWAGHAELLADIRKATTDPLGVYGNPLPEGTRPPTTTAEKDATWRTLMYGHNRYAASPYRRLKLVMDYWCSLWFWPMEHAEELPDRSEFLADVSLLLEFGMVQQLQNTDRHGQSSLFEATSAAAKAQALAAELGQVDVDKLIARNPRFQRVVELSERYRFLHWELEFADVFQERGGFDVMLGNPPWIPIRWDEAGVLGDADPSIVVKKLSSNQVGKLRDTVLARSEARKSYLTAHESIIGTQEFLKATQNYPALGTGIRVNLYKAFLPLIWYVNAPGGAAGLLHPEGVYDDPNGGTLREAIYPRLRRHYQFMNELDLFAEVHHQTKFSINVFGESRTFPKFIHMANLFATTTVDQSHTHHGRGAVPGIKEDGSWSVDGHSNRIVPVGPGALKTFAKLYDGEGVPGGQARLPAVHSRNLLATLEAFSGAPRLESLTRNYKPSPMWHERHAVRDGIIKRAEPAVFPTDPSGLILSGPHFFVGNPHYKSPRAVCTNNSHYDVLDLTTLPADYLPRTNYVPACTDALYADKTPKVPWSSKEDPIGITSYYRVIVPNMIGPAGERTLQPAISSRPAGHVNTVNSYAFKNTKDLLLAQSSWCSMPVDFFVKSTGAGHFQPNMAAQVPIATDHYNELATRTLLLNCLTTHYAALWRDTFDPAFTEDRWAKADPRLDNAHFANLADEWRYTTPLRTDYARRQALVELDVLVSMGLGLTLDQLQTLYRAQFYVMRGYEADTWYDRNGRIVFTNSKGLVGVGLPRNSKKNDPTPGWNDVKDMTEGVVRHTVMDDTLPGGPTERVIEYVAPFDRCDREQDYAVVWKSFEERFGGQA